MHSTMTGEKERQRLLLQERLAGRQSKLAAKHEAQMQSVAPEVAALTAKLEEMQREKEAELNEMHNAKERCAAGGPSRSDDVDEDMMPCKL